MAKNLLAICSFVLTISITITNAQTNNNCARFDSRSCCPNLPSVVSVSIREGYSRGPLYVVFVPVTPLNQLIDNICYNVAGLPDDFSTLLLSISRVYSNGRNEIISYIISQISPGFTKHGSAQCSFLDIPFATVTIEGSNNCDILLVYRCVLDNGCGGEFDVNPPILGVSYNPRPISNECIQMAKETIRTFGFPDQDYITYPMRLPTKCVFGEFCYRLSNTQEFQRLIGQY